MQLVFPMPNVVQMAMRVIARGHLRAIPSAAETLKGSDGSQEHDPDPDRADRAFLMKVMDSHPEALQSETGMMLLMGQYPREL